MKLKEFPNSLITSFTLCVTKPNLNKEILPVIVSLTTIESRIKKVHITIRSLLKQDKLPKKILLWIYENDFSKIPSSLKKLENDIFEIHSTPLQCSHKKLIHSLQLYPELPIVTCDDDLIYHKTWLSTTYAEHVKNPTFIIGNQTRIISYREHKVAPYKTWQHSKNTDYHSLLTLPIGANGVIYPPNSLNRLVFDKELFLKLAPKADDLWFKAMALLQQTISIQSPNPPPAPIPIAGTQKISLKKQNVNQDKNSIQWQALHDFFKFNF